MSSSKAPTPECLSLQEIEHLVGGGTLEPSSRDHASSCELCRGKASQVRENLRLADQLVAVGSPEPLAAAPAPAPPVIEGYEVLEEIHRGGQGVVLRGIQRATKRPVAIKLLLEGTLASERRLRRFEREIEVVAGLDHPHVVTVYDSGFTADHRPYLVMEYVDGVPLDEYARGTEGWSLLDSLHLVAALCGAVSFAHQRGVIHRDLKPSNVLVTPAGEPRVLDFGLARMDEPSSTAADEPPVTLTGEFAGTLSYASPEQVSGVRDSVDVRTDVYSLGVVLYQLLTGHYPYPLVGKLADVARTIVEVEPRPPSAYQDDPHRPPGRIDHDLDTLALKALAKDRERRYQSAGEFGRDLERYLAGEPIDARRDSTWYVLGKLLLRHRLRAALASLAAVAVLVTSVIALVFWKEARNEADVAQREAAKAREFTNFVDEVLASPYWAEGRLATMKEALARASERIDAGSFESPETRAELHRWLGRTYENLDLHEPAESQFRAALQLFRQVHGEDHADVAKGLAQLAHMRDQRCGFEEARELFEEAVVLQRRLLPPDDPVLARTLTDRAALYDSMGDARTAASLFQEAEDFIRTHQGEDSVELATCLESHAVMLAASRRHPQAAEKLREALAIWQARPGHYSRASSASTLRLLGRSLDAMGRAAEAQECLSEAHALLRALFGDDHPSAIMYLLDIAQAANRQLGLPAARDLYLEARRRQEALRLQPSPNSAYCLNSLGLLAQVDGDCGAAEGFLRESLAMYREFLSEDLPEVAIVKSNLAMLLKDLGRLPEAEALAREALASATLRDDRDDMAAQWNVLGWIFSARGDPRQARDCAQKALELSREMFGEEDLKVARILNSLGWFQLWSRDTAQAEDNLRAGLAIREDLFEAGHPLIAESRHFLGWLYFTVGKLDEAEPLLKSALEIRRARLGLRHPYLVWSLNAVSRWHLAKGQAEAAEVIAGEAVELSQDLEAEREQLVPISLYNLASALRAQGEYELAEEALLERHAFFVETFGEESPAALESLRGLITLYEAMGDRDEATAMRQRLAEITAGGSRSP